MYLCSIYMPNWREKSSIMLVYTLHNTTHTLCNALYVATQASMYAMGGYSHVHTSVAGSGFHLPSAPHIAVILILGTNPELHLKNISAPSVVF